MRISKNIKIFINSFLGPLLFVWLSWSIYTQIRRQPNLEEAWQTIRESINSPLVWNLAAVILLMIVNWSFEAIKWKISVKDIQQVSFLKALRAVLSGVSFSVSTTNRVWEYLGSVLYMYDGNRFKNYSTLNNASIKFERMEGMRTVLRGNQLSWCISDAKGNLYYTDSIGKLQTFTHKKGST